MLKHKLFSIFMKMEIDFNQFQFFQEREQDGNTKAETVSNVRFQVTFGDPNGSKCSMGKYQTHSCGEVADEEPIDLTTFSKESNGHIESSKSEVKLKK